MSQEEITAVEQIDENQLLNDGTDENSLTNEDAVSLFNASLREALQRQKKELLAEFKKDRATEINSVTQVSPEVVTYTNINPPSSADKVSSAGTHTLPFEFKGEGPKIQFNFNSERITALRKIESLVQSNSTGGVQAIIQSELDALNQRNKVLKIADRHGWDTVHEYMDDRQADSVEDAAKLRSAIIRASRKRTASKPYSRGSGRGGFNARAFFRGFGQSYGQRHEDFSAQSNNTRQFNDGLCFYCKRPGHIARSCPYKPRTSTRSATVSTPMAQPQSN